MLSYYHLQKKTDTPTLRAEKNRKNRRVVWCQTDQFRGFRVIFGPMVLFGGCALIDATPVNHLNWKQARRLDLKVAGGARYDATWKKDSGLLFFFFLRGIVYNLILFQHTFSPEFFGRDIECWGLDGSSSYFFLLVIRWVCGQPVGRVFSRIHGCEPAFGLLETPVVNINKRWASRSPVKKLKKSPIHNCCGLRFSKIFGGFWGFDLSIWITVKESKSTPAMPNAQEIRPYYEIFNQ